MLPAWRSFGSYRERSAAPAYDSGFYDVSMTFSRLTTILILGAMIGGAQLRSLRELDRLQRPLSEIPNDLSGWRATADLELDPQALRVLSPSSYLSRVYKNAESELGLFVAYYADQNTAEAMHSPKNCLPGAGWEIWNYGSVEVPTSTGFAVVNNYSISKDQSRMNVLYWYQTRKRLFANEYIGKYYLIRDSLLSNVSSGALVRVVVADHPDQLRSAIQFSAEVIPQIQLSLGR